MKNLIIGYPRGRNKWHGLSKALEKIGQEVDIVIENFDQIEGPYDRVWAMAESLLPLQAQLEKKWGIDNISEEAADILSDKKKMDDFCISVGLQEIIPYSVIPTNLDDLQRFKNKSFIIKPVIGSGTKMDYDTSVDYISYKNTEEFMKSVPCDLLFKVNKTGFYDEKFNNRLNFYMVQEHLAHTMFYAPYVYINEEGNIKFITWIECIIEYNKIDEFRFECKPTNFMMVDSDEVPQRVKYYSEFFFETIVDELKLKNMFFAGPDFYYDVNLPIKIIDANPRIGQGLQILNEVHNEELLPKILSNEPFELDTYFWWVLADLKPGTIKEVKDMSHLQEYMLTTNPELHAGKVIPKFTYGVMEQYAKIGLKIPGKNRTDMIETYRSINSQIQDCIVYA